MTCVPDGGFALADRTQFRVLVDSKTRWRLISCQPVGQLSGHDTNIKRDKRKWAYDTIGKVRGDLARYGVSTQLPFDFSGRLGLGNMLPATSILKPSDAQRRDRQWAELAGPAYGGLVNQALDAWDAWALGDRSGAFVAVLPTAAKNAVAGAKLAATGVAKDAKGQKVADVTLSGAFWKSIGLNPTVIAKQSRTNMPIYQDKALHTAVQAKITEMWVSGIVERDDDKEAQAQKLLHDWNENAGMPIVIRPQTLRSKLAAAHMEGRDRLLKSTPRANRAAVAAQLDAGHEN
ncbi:PLxRFG domain-containing protein [Herbaspirillum sp. GCM10030257]|uniref:PLxRFG domain-containing protein n=1 Tax=Herbaspirillum sp. GCM10030257 TaxID=3273393 RepID=UPI00360E6D5D